MKQSKPILKYAFKPGTRVRLIDESVCGEVVRGLGNDIFEVLTEDGFTYEIHGSGLIEERVGEDAHALGNPLDPENHSSSGGKLSSQKEKTESVMEVDLHFEALPEYSKRCTPGEILAIQIRHLERHLDTARTRRLRKLIVIHGVGEGVLRENVITLLSALEDVSFYDASYAQYGRGATEVLFHKHR